MSWRSPLSGISRHRTGTTAAWVGASPPASVLVLGGPDSAAVFVARSCGAFRPNALGRGECEPFLSFRSSLAVASLGLSLALLPRLGMAGAAWGLLLPMLLAAVAYLYIASRVCQTRVRDLLPRRGRIAPPVSRLPGGHHRDPAPVPPGMDGCYCCLAGERARLPGGLLLLRARKEELVFVRKCWPRL